MSDIYEKLAAYGTATVYEAMGRSGLIDAEFHQLIPGSRAAGPAVVARCAHGDNLMVHAVMEHVTPGSILVLAMDNPAPYAVIGDLLATQARVRGAAAVLVDAASRDVEELRAMGLPVWTRFIRVKGAAKETPGSVNEPVTVGGATINPGDIVILDGDGVVVVPADKAQTAVEAAAARVAKEDAFRKKLEAGNLSYDLHGLRAKVEGGNR